MSCHEENKHIISSRRYVETTTRGQTEAFEQLKEYYRVRTQDELDPEYPIKFEFIAFDGSVWYIQEHDLIKKKFNFYPEVPEDLRKAVIETWFSSVQIAEETFISYTKWRKEAEELLKLQLKIIHNSKS